MTALQLEQEAKATVALHNKLYSDLIQKSIDGTKIYRDGSSFQEMIKPLEKKVENLVPFEMLGTKSFKAITNLALKPDYKDKKIAILNGGDYKNAGGRFLQGGRSSESDLCHNSFLYNVLSAFDKEYYIPNQRKINKSLFTEAALYTPGIYFNLLEDKSDEKPNKEIDIITCSPPNMNAYLKYHYYQENKTLKTLEYRPFEIERAVIKRRLEFIKKICELNDIKILILDVWGSSFKSKEGVDSDILYRQLNYIFKMSSSLEKVMFISPDAFYEQSLLNRLIEQHNGEIQDEIEKTS